MAGIFSKIISVTLFLMKNILTIFFSCFAAICYSQPPNQSSISDSGKVEFKKQSAAEKPDYSAAYRILKNQVKLFPNNAELHYFLGYTIDRMNAFDGNTMFEIKMGKTVEASEQFELVNKLSPQYKGEYVVLDPYAKLSSIWGSLAQSYLHRKLKDSAVWAFNEGKKRGGFIEPILHYNRQMLNSCSKNAILISNGDNITIPSWYLQEIENLRTDITIVDANLINTSWYPKYLKKEKQLNISFTDNEIDSIDYVEFKPRYITITNPKDSIQKFTWQLKPTYGQYILKGDRILLNILKQNLFERDIYFNANSDTTWNLFLSDYLQDEGLVNKIRLKEIDLKGASDTVSINFSDYTIDKLAAAEINKSQDAIIVLNNYRWAYYNNIARLLFYKKKNKARILKNEMELKFPLSKLPYSFEGAAEYFKKLFSEID